jgi:D-alanine-D-alanine ligase-like ATP-grasp enzyme
MNIKNSSQKPLKLAENEEFLINMGSEMGIEWEVIGAKTPILLAHRNDKTYAFYKGRIRINSSGSAKISKDKNLTKLVLSQVGIDTPKGIIVKDLDQLEELFFHKNLLKYPLVVKPNDEALGTGVVADIRSYEELYRIAREVGKDRSKILVEEYFDGVDHRFLVLDGEVLAVAKRVKPQVIGDGEKSIRELVDRYNEGRIRHVQFDSELTRYIAHQGYKTGGRSIDATDEVAKGYKDVAIKAASVMGMRLAGIDILIKDPSVFTDYKLTEVNSVPGFDVHVHPDEGKKRTEILIKILDKVVPQ